MKLRGLFTISLATMFSLILTAQDGFSTIGETGNENETIRKKLLRSENVVFPGGGVSMINGDYSNPKYQNFGQIGYKRFLSRMFNLNMSFKRHNLDTDRDIFRDFGFMSLDLNLEMYILPSNQVSPFIYLGGGLVADNSLNKTMNKIQGGIGLEYLFTNKLALMLAIDSNYTLENNIDPELFRNLDEFFLGAMLGVNFYFGNSKVPNTNVEAVEPTVINSYPITSEN